MKILVITSYRSGSGYCVESISQLLGCVNLNEILSRAFPESTYSYNDNIIKINYEILDKKYDRLSVNYPVDVLYERLDWLKNSKNNWVAKIHADQLLMLDSNFFKEFLNFYKITPVFLYRENTYNRILSMILAYEMNKYRFDKNDTVPDIKVEYDRNKHADIINQIIDSVDILQDIYKKYNWFKVYNYENLTHRPNVDFSVFGNKDNILVPKIAFKDKESRILNLDKLKEDFKWKNLKITT